MACALWTSAFRILQRSEEIESQKSFEFGVVFSLIAGVGLANREDFPARLTKPPRSMS